VLLLLELFDGSEGETTIFYSVAGCYKRTNLHRVCEYFELTILLYFPDEFESHFRMAKEACELFIRKAMPAGRTPLGNGSG